MSVSKKIFFYGPFLFFILMLTSCSSMSMDKRTNPYRSIELYSTQEKIGDVSFSAKDFWGSKLVLLPAEVWIYEREDLSLLSFKYQGNKYELIVDRETRNMLHESFLQYEKRYDSRDLLNSRKTVDEFGTVYGMVRWGAFMISSVAYPLIKVGYSFEEKHPYFSIFWPESQNNRSSSYSPGNIENLQPSKFFFTINQMRSLIEIWSSTGLLGIQQPEFKDKLMIDEY